MEHERIIHTLEYLQRYSDEEHFVTLRDIKDHLESNYGYVNVSVLTIRRDLQRLEATGKHLTVKKGSHNTTYYSMTESGFTFNEIRFLVDSVSINKFLSDAQKQRLFKKFEGMCSAAEVRKLISRIHLTDVPLPMLDLLENLEKVHSAISEKRKIDFQYGSFDVHKNMNYYSKRRDLAPLQVIYYDNRFYMKCRNLADGNLRTYRIDRMKNVKLVEKHSERMTVKKPDGAVLDMFEPDYYENVKLKVRRNLIGDMIERFGKYASLQKIPDDDEHVIVKVYLGIGKSFSHWMMRYGSNLEVIGPPHVRELYVKELSELCEVYGLRGK